MASADLPPLIAGQSGLPALLVVEEALLGRLAEGRRQAERRVEEARRRADDLRREGEARLKQVLLDAQEGARREAESRARDRISERRVEVQRWVERAEEASRGALDEALDLLTGA